MRVSLPALAAVSLLFLAACSGGGTGQAPAAAPAPTAASAVPPAPIDPSVAASADAALSSDTEAICAQAGRVSSAFGQTFIADIKLQAEAAGQGAEAKQRADQKVERDMMSHSYALADMAKLTADPALKKALTGMSKQVATFKGDLTKIDGDKLAELTGTLDKACGNG
ncbi:hypothetical protein AB0J83_33330 [Actinoplanes sp. NPDC049596]|uniref:hypothetical protein n=1 Tax=unclassified Actinoplanes TaxID=2626549 RepID=UPI0034407EAB